MDVDDSADTLSSCDCSEQLINNQLFRSIQQGHVPTVIDLADILHIVELLSPDNQNVDTDSTSGLYYVVDV